MDKTLRIRQQKYRDRQKSKGRKTITLQLPEDLINTLHTGKDGDTLSAYVERVILAGLKSVTNNVDRTKTGKGVPLKVHDWDATEKKYNDDIEQGKRRYVQTLAESGYTYAAIAQKLTFDGYPKLAGKSRWTANTVRAILKDR